MHSANLVVLSFALGFLLLSAEARALGDGPRSRALLVGIDDYLGSSAEALEAPEAGVEDRGWSDLKGAGNDVEVLEALLVSRFGFDAGDILVLRDGEATRQAILSAMKGHLLDPARPGDQVVFYFSGHGSQVYNSLSREPEKLDETLEPADSRSGSRGLHDKELREIFHRILDKGARLTAIFDSCHSGSVSRGLPLSGGLKGLGADLRDVARAPRPGPTPQERGALILAATSDEAPAWETRDASGTWRGAFSLALFGVLQQSLPSESAERIFQRTQGRLQALKPWQRPKIGGSPETRRRPLFGGAGRESPEAASVAVERVRDDGTVILQGGWVHGLSLGSRLVRTGGGPHQPPIILEVRELLGLSRSEAEPSGGTSGLARAHPVEAGDLFEPLGWTAPPVSRMALWIPTASPGVAPAAELAAELAALAQERGLRWVQDPVAETPSHVLRWNREAWELWSEELRSEELWTEKSSWRRLGARPRVEEVLTGLDLSKDSLFVQLPAPPEVRRELDRKAGENHVLELVETPDLADYHLVGRLRGGAVEYAWVRPGTLLGETGGSGLPPRTRWVSLSEGRLQPASKRSSLEAAALKLAKIRAWQLAESPPEGKFPYRLEIERASDGSPVTDGRLVAGELYSLALRLEAGAEPPDPQERRSVYVFLIDSEGESVRLYPPPAWEDVENRFPLPKKLVPQEAPAPERISLGPASRFQAIEPLGKDTYFLLATYEELTQPWVLEWEGLEWQEPRTASGLEEFLAGLSSRRRYQHRPFHTTVDWSLERQVFEVVPAEESDEP